MENYDIQTAELTVETDRAVLLRIVDELFSEPKILQPQRPKEKRRSSNPFRRRSRKSSAKSEIVNKKNENEDPNVTESPTESEATPQESAELVGGRTSTIDGIAAFNAALKKHVPKQLPLSGMRSWKLFGYQTAVLVFGCMHITAFYDLWSWRSADATEQVTPDTAPTAFTEFATTASVANNDAQTSFADMIADFGTNIREGDSGVNCG